MATVSTDAILVSLSDFLPDARFRTLGVIEQPQAVERLSAARDLDSRQALAKADSFAALLPDLRTAVDALDAAVTALTSARSLLRDLVHQVELAQVSTASAEDRRSYALAYDQSLRDFNNIINAASGGGLNLIGGVERGIFLPNDVEYVARPGSFNTESVSGSYLGSDFFIEDGSGDQFFPGAFGRQLEELPEPSPVNEIELLEDDTIVFDFDTGAIDLTRDGAGAPFLSGTVTRAGIRLLNSYLYEGFQDSGLRDQAATDVRDAITRFDAATATFEAQRATASARLAFTEAVVAQNLDITIKLESGFETVNLATYSADGELQQGRDGNSLLELLV
jgi:hypothetical protein